MPISLSERFESVEASGLQEALGLQVFGLRWQGDGELAYTTLDEALGAQTLEITEVSAAGSVPRLKVVNRGAERVFLMAGEQLVGAKQNRVLNCSLMVAARGEMEVPVSCVEAGRWRDQSPKFASPGTMSHGLLRKLMSQHTREGYERTGTPTSHQGAVWAEVGRKLGAMGSASPTSAVLKVYEDYQKRLADLLDRMRAPAGCHGAVFAIGGRVAGVDLFDRPATLAKLWSKLLQAYAIAALEVGAAGAPPVQAGTPPVQAGTPPITEGDAGRWVRAAARARADAFQSPGEGHDVRLRGEGLVGAALIVEDQPVHVEMFAAEA